MDTSPCPTPLPSHAPDLGARALAALCERDPARKCAAVHALWAERQVARRQAPASALRAQCPWPLPGRPEHPELIDPSGVPQRSPFTPLGRAALAHAVAHIEFNAINLALDAIWRFDDLPEAYYQDWLRVAHEEARHFGLMQTELARHGKTYGDFEAHDGLWQMCERTAHDLTARMALVPRTLEARGLDATPLIQARLRKVNTDDAHALVAALEVILQEEVAHVAIGDRWYRWCCAREGLAPEPHFLALIERYRAPRPRPPLNLSARRDAGFGEAELAFLNQTDALWPRPV